jgi:serine/threonine protein kinase
MEMPYFPCGTLYYSLQDPTRARPLPVDAPTIFFRLIGALQFLQEASFVHNGISLSNIILNGVPHARRDFALADPNICPVLIGFSQLSKAEQGISLRPFKRDRNDPTVSPFLAPELRRARRPFGTFATDIYALGVCFRLMVDLTQCPLQIQSMVDWMLEEDPDDRPTIHDLRAHKAFVSQPSEDCRAADAAIIHVVEIFDQPGT